MALEAQAGCMQKHTSVFDDAVHEVVKLEPSAERREVHERLPSPGLQRRVVLRALLNP